MKTAKIFRRGNSQAVRIPKEFQMQGEEVQSERKGELSLLGPKKRSWDAFSESLHKFTDDFMRDGRNQAQLQKRGGAFS